MKGVLLCRPIVPLFPAAKPRFLCLDPWRSLMNQVAYFVKCRIEFVICDCCNQRLLFFSCFPLFLVTKPFLNVINYCFGISMSPDNLS